MIIANALKRLFTGLTVDTVLLGVNKPNTSIQFWYGDQKELISWITERKNLVKYPLIWYVLSDYTEFQGWHETNARLVIMQDTQLSPLNDWRSSNSYDGILEPVKDKVVETLTQSGFVEVMGNLSDRFKLRTIPNYGVDIESNDLKGGSSSNKSFSIDIVDCLTIDFRLRIKAKCII